MFHAKFLYSKWALNVSCPPLAIGSRSTMDPFRGLLAGDCGASATNGPSLPSRSLSCQWAKWKFSALSGQRGPESRRSVARRPKQVDPQLLTEATMFAMTPSPRTAAPTLGSRRPPPNQGPVISPNPPPVARLLRRHRRRRPRQLR